MIQGRHGKFWSGKTLDSHSTNAPPSCWHCATATFVLEISRQTSFLGCLTSCGGPVISKNSTFVFATIEYCVKCDNKLLKMRNNVQLCKKLGLVI